MDQAALTNRTVLPRPQLRALPQVVGVDDADDRVAAGRRVVGQQHHGLPVRRHLDRAEHHPLARQLGGPRAPRRRHRRAAGRPGSTPAARRTSRRRAPPSASAAKQSGVRPGEHAAAARRRAVAGCRAAAARPPAARPGSADAVHDPGRTDPGQGVGGPRAEDRARRRCRRRPRRRTARPSAGGPTASRPPAGTHSARACAPSGAGDRHPQAHGSARDLEAAEGHLEQRRVGPVADQPVGQVGGRPVQRPGPRARRGGPSPTRPRSWTVVSAPARTTSRALMPAPAGPGCRARAAPGVSLGRPTAWRRCGRAAASHPARRSGRPRTSGRRARPSPAGTRRRGVSSRGTASSGGQAAQVGEPRREAAERRDELDPGEPATTPSTSVPQRAATSSRSAPS